MVLSMEYIASEYGLFKPDEDPVKGRWLEQGKTLGYYHFKNGVREMLCDWEMLRVHNVLLGFVRIS